MKISDLEIDYLAKLSKFSLDESEINQLKQDLSNILNYVAQLNEVDTTGIEPTYQVLDLKNVWQNDEMATDNVDPETLIELSADVMDRQIKVPKVL